MSEQKEQIEEIKYDIDTLFADAFEQKSKDPYISCIFWGPPESGKSYGAMTFPGPLIILDLDGGIRANLKYYKDKDGNPTKKIKRIRCVSLKDDAVQPDDVEYDWKKVDPINTLRNFDVALSELQPFTGGTVIIDTMSAYNNWLRMEMEARGPKKISDKGVEYIDQIDWKFVNQKWIWAWEKLKNIDANIVVVGQEKPVYQGREITDRVEPDLRTKPEYNVDIMAKFVKEVKQDPSGVVTVKRIAEFSKFRGNKFGCTHNIEDCTYDKIMEMLRSEKMV